MLLVYPTDIGSKGVGWGGAASGSTQWRQAEEQHVSKAAFRGQTAPNDKEAQLLFHMSAPHTVMHNVVGEAQSKAK